jgi:hypothetical protein
MLAYALKSDPQDEIDLSHPWFDGVESERIQEVLRGRVGGDGPFCRKVEARLSAMTGGRELAGGARVAVRGRVADALHELEGQS